MDHTFDSGQFQEEEEEYEDVYLKNAEWDASLIDAVRGYPHLYKKQSKDFKNQIMRDQSWSEIASATKSSVDECQRRWTRLRERFSRERKYRESETRSGSGSMNRRGFHLYEKMIFLTDHMQSRRTFTNLNEGKQGNVKFSLHQLLQRQPLQQIPLIEREQQQLPQQQRLFTSPVMKPIQHPLSKQQQSLPLTEFSQQPSNPKLIGQAITNPHPGTYYSLPSPPLSSSFDIDFTFYLTAEKESTNSYETTVSPPITSPNYVSDDSRTSTSTPPNTTTAASTSKQVGQHIGFPSTSQSSRTAGPLPKRKRVIKSVEADFCRFTSEMTRTMGEMRSPKPIGEIDAFAQWMAAVLQRVPSTRRTKLMSRINQIVCEELDEES